MVVGVPEHLAQPFAQHERVAVGVEIASRVGVGPHVEDRHVRGGPLGRVDEHRPGARRRPVAVADVRLGVARVRIQWLAEPGRHGLAHVRAMVRTGEHRPADRMVDHLERRGRTSAALTVRGHLDGVGAELESVDQTDQAARVVVGRCERSRDVATVDREADLVRRDGPWDVDPHQDVTAGDGVRTRRQRRDDEPGRDRRIAQGLRRDVADSPASSLATRSAGKPGDQDTDGADVRRRRADLAFLSHAGCKPPSPDDARRVPLPLLERGEQPRLVGVAEVDDR
jgi:hypothetical protein